MAIDDLLDEHEQSERVLAWLRSNGAGLIGGIIVGLALILGWQWWGGKQAASDMRAGDDYQAMLKSLEAKDIKKAQSQAAALHDTPYAPLAVLDLAKAQVEAGQRDAAISTLRTAQSPNPVLEQVIKQRLARLLIDSGKAGEALKVLGNEDDPATLEVRGDAQVALGKREDARKSYTEVLAKLDVASPGRRLVELKLTDVGGSAAKPEARI
jgi:predicted negative regulator of RcsB-dependent stress response